jgi:hypothetical protein
MHETIQVHRKGIKGKQPEDKEADRNFQCFTVKIKGYLSSMKRFALLNKPLMLWEGL